MSPEEENEKDIGGDYLKCAACGKKDQTISLNDVGPEPSFPACHGNADEVDSAIPSYRHFSALALCWSLDFGAWPQFKSLETV